MPASIRIFGYGTLAAVAVTLVVLGTPVRPNAASPAQAQTAPATPSPAASGGGITLHSVSVELPTGTFSFAVPGGAEALDTNCVACHSTAMILNQPPLTNAQWTAEVTHMQRDFKAPVADADVPAIVAELVRLRGAQ